MNMKNTKNIKRPPIKRDGGFILIMSIIILAAVGVALVSALLSSSVGGYKIARLGESSVQARGLADACAEIALQKLTTSASFTGTGSATIGNGSCSYTVAAVGSVGTVTSSSTVGAVVRKVKILLSVPQLILASWQEVGDF